jgi:hypothetical protein
MDLFWISNFNGVKILNIVTSDVLFDIIEIELYRSNTEKYDYIWVGVEILQTESVNTILYELGFDNKYNVCIWNESRTKNISSDDSCLMKYKFKFDKVSLLKKHKWRSFAKTLESCISYFEYDELIKEFMTRVYSADDLQKFELLNVFLVEEKYCNKYTPVLKYL